jgi:hypothetical protein
MIARRSRSYWSDCSCSTHTTLLDGRRTKKQEGANKHIWSFQESYRDWTGQKGTTRLRREWMDGWDLVFSFFLVSSLYRSFFFLSRYFCAEVKGWRHILMCFLISKLLYIVHTLFPRKRNLSVFFFAPFPTLSSWDCAGSILLLLLLLLPWDSESLRSYAAAGSGEFERSHLGHSCESSTRYLWASFRIEFRFTDCISRLT